MKKLYYSIEKEIEDNTLTGNKTITGYVIENSELIKKFTIEADISDISKDVIQEHLYFNGDETKYTFILL